MDGRNDLFRNEPIYLSDESGEEMAFRFLDLIRHEEQEYIVLMAEEGPFQNEALILRLDKDENGAESYVDVEDPVTLRTVYRLFKEHFRDNFIFED
jgi:uncharacterized protein YrzB (UPF0473 family)